VDCLLVHLPGQNTPQFTGGTSHGSSASLLIRYFHRPHLPQFTSLLYTEYFEQYLLYKWDPRVPLGEDEYLEDEILGTEPKKICPHHIGKKVTQIQTLSPTTGEVFYLCCLLGRRAAYDFDELCTINGVVYETYHEAALSN
jgi:hypothetical protein